MELQVQRVKLFGQTAGRVATLLSEAFPPAAQEPFPLLVALAKRPGIDFLAFYDEDVFCGFAYCITKADLTYVMYLAVSGQSRSKGYGTAILDAIKQAYPENAIALDIESLSVLATNRPQRIKRQAFYFRNGFRELGVRMPEGNDMYDILVYGRQVSPDEIADVLAWFSFGVFRPTFTPYAVKQDA